MCNADKDILSTGKQFCFKSELEVRLTGSSSRRRNRKLRQTLRNTNRKFFGGRARAGDAALIPEARTNWHQN
ncbi:Hypothetical predicted protein [Pelobates cultripes]|uniref:Uncharacterized protein n=1 Tax=Pelobates cultripes TaxID=61616 RepID=A0AAD1RCH6_PELCU|nr:Hypothetical predicted protein [Pelobates cultripes]